MEEVLNGIGYLTYEELCNLLIVIKKRIANKEAAKTIS